MLPSQAWKRNAYCKRPSSRSGIAGETISLGIGQGYNNFTMLQLAQATATLANNGVKHKPHLVVGDAGHRARTPKCRCRSQPPEDLGLQARNMWRSCARPWWA